MDDERQDAPAGKGANGADASLEPAGGRGDMRPHPYATIAARALRQGWGLTEDDRAAVLEEARRLIRTGRTDRDRAAGCRILIAADSVDARREATASSDAVGRAKAATSVVRAALATPGGREALDALTSAVCQPALPAPPQQGQEAAPGSADEKIAPPEGS